jgi:hypothetical protein
MQGQGTSHNRLSDLAIPRGKRCGRPSLAPRCYGEAGGPPASPELHGLSAQGEGAAVISAYPSGHVNQMGTPGMAGPFTKER